MSEKEKTLRVVVKPPMGNPEVTNITPDLDGLQGALDGGFLEIVSLPELQSVGVHMYVDEEGKLKGLPPNFTIPGDVIRGPVVFSASDDEGNEASLTDAQVKAVMERLGCHW